MHVMRALTVALMLPAVPCVAAEWSYLDVDGEAVRIYRDDFGVPHIHAQTVRGTFYAMGYVVAEDRLMQFENNRRYALGQLAEIYGPDFAMIDLVTRRNTYTEAERQQQFEALSAETQAVFHAYADGVNARIIEVLADPDHKLPKEFWDLGISMRPWTVLDSVATATMMLRRFGERGGNELANLAELERIGPDEFDRLYPLNNPAAPTTIPPGEDGHPLEKSDASANLPEPGHWPPVAADVAQRIEEDRERLAWAAVQVGFPVQIGSYGAVLGPGKTGSEHAIILGCPWMRIEMPSPPPSSANEIDLHGPGIDVTGVNFAGTPGVFLGHSSWAAWTATTGRSDNVDTYIEELNPGNHILYWHQGEWLTLEHRTETIKVLGQPDQEVLLFRSVHGPVFEYDLDHHHAFAWKYAFRGQEILSIEAVLGMAWARSLDEWREAAAKVTVGLNFQYADIAGNIAFFHTGRYRVPAVGVDPRLPSLGTGEEEWLRVLDFAEQPQCVNPLQGWFANFNNKPAVWWTNGDLGWWESTHFVSTLFAAISSKPTLTFEEFADIPRLIDKHGTYEHVVRMAPPFDVAESILPPGQSGFVDKDGNHDVHFHDQDSLYADWQRKPFVYFYDSDGDGLFDQEEDFLNTIADHPDTDADGLRDGDEARDLDLHTPGVQNPFNPNAPDSTGDHYRPGSDGVRDGLNDWDGDRLANDLEFQTGTNPLVPDPGEGEGAGEGEGEGQNEGTAEGEHEGQAEGAPEGEGEGPNEGEGETTGSLMVTIEPEEARTAGARWRADGGEWRGSGETLDGLSAGVHQVQCREIETPSRPGCFGSVPTWRTPEDQTVSVLPGQAAMIEAHYSRT